MDKLSDTNYHPEPQIGVAPDDNIPPSYSKKGVLQQDVVLNSNSSNILRTPKDSNQLAPL
jgi:hypothetical protein